MKKYVFVFAFIVFLGFFALLSFRRKQVPLVVIGTTPQQHATLSPFVSVVIRFNRPPKTGEYSVVVEPKTEYTLLPLADSSIQIRPKTSFLEETPYTITINSGSLYVLSFTTLQAAGSIPGWNEDFDRALDEAKKINGAQDDALYVIRKAAPITQDVFTINYSYKTDTYTVSLLQPYEQSKAAFIDWINKAGVTNLSIVSIKYVNQ